MEGGKREQAQWSEQLTCQQQQKQMKQNNQKMYNLSPSLHSTGIIWSETTFNEFTKDKKRIRKSRRRHLLVVDK